MFQKKLNYVIINLAALMILLYIGLSNLGLWWGILVKCASLLAPFLAAFAFAYAFTPLVNYLDKRLPKAMAIIIVVVGLILIVGGLLYFTLPMLYEQLSLLIKTLMQVFRTFDDKFHLNIGSFELQVTDFLNDTLKDIGSVTSATTVGIVGKSVGFLGKFIVGFVGFIYFF